MNCISNNIPYFTDCRGYDKAGISKNYYHLFDNKLPRGSLVF